MIILRRMLLGLVIGSCCLIVAGSVLQVRMADEKVVSALLLWSQQEVIVVLDKRTLGSEEPFWGFLLRQFAGYFFRSIGTPGVEV